MTSPSTKPVFDPSSIEAAVFDIGGVFLYPHHQQVTGVLADMGVELTDDLIQYRRAHHAGVAALSAATMETREHDPDFWIRYDEAYLSTLGADPGIVFDFRRRVERREWDWLHEENVASFHELHASGMPLAIVSNNTGAAPEQMRDHGVCWVNDREDLPRVAAIIDSSLVGVAKPDPAIMAPALHALGVPAERVLYVGDTVHADVMGATAAGMQSVQLDPFDHHADYDHARLPDLAALTSLLT
jgi:putative hydrolase of the HAD superfamily